MEKQHNAGGAGERQGQFGLICSAGIHLPRSRFLRFSPDAAGSWDERRCLRCADQTRQPLPGHAAAPKLALWTAAVMRHIGTMPRNSRRLIRIRMFDRAHSQRIFRQCGPSYDANALLQREVARHLLELAERCFAAQRADSRPWMRHGRSIYRSAQNPGGIYRHRIWHYRMCSLAHEYRRAITADAALLPFADASFDRRVFLADAAMGK